MTVQPHAGQRPAHAFGCVGFWLWALVGAGTVFAFISFIGGPFLIPAAVLGYGLRRRSRWNEGHTMLGLVAGAGFPFLLVAGLRWTDWHHRIAGDNTPNPFYWGGVGLFLLAAGTVAYAVRSR